MKRGKFNRLWCRLAEENSGSALVIFAFAALGLILAAGLALDYSSGLSRKTSLNAAADAAALAALSQAQSDYAANLATAQIIADAQAAAARVFVGNAGPLASLLTQPATVVTTRTGQTVTTTVSYSAVMPNVFGKFANSLNTSFSGSATSTMTLPSYLNFYLLLDVSASMGIPSTASEITRLAAINPDFLNLYPGGCTIACHFTAYQACQNAKGQTTWCQGYNLTRTAGGSGAPVSYCPQPGQSNCIQLRLDAVAYATQQLINTAQATQTLPGQFGIGLYPFIRWMQSYQPLTTSLATVSAAAAGLTGLVDNGNGSSALGSGGTHFENALPAINTAVSTVGDGSSSASPRPFVFMVTDGAQDSQYQQNNGAWTGSNSATTLDTTNCTAIKNRGIILSVLYVPYVPIPNPTTIWGDEDGYANANIPNIPPSLQACASPGFFFTASSPGEIATAMQAMFQMAVASAHLTQ